MIGKVNNDISLIDAVEKLPGITVYRAGDPEFQGPLFSFSHASIDCGTFARMLEEHSGIETRAGLHCAPLAHRTLGTFPAGTVRIAASPYHTPDDFANLVSSIESVIAS